MFSILRFWQNFLNFHGRLQIEDSSMLRFGRNFHYFSQFSAFIGIRSYTQFYNSACKYRIHKICGRTFGAFGRGGSASVKASTWPSDNGGLNSPTRASIVACHDDTISNINNGSRSRRAELIHCQQAIIRVFGQK